MVSEAARYQQLINEALVYRDGGRARRGFGKQFRQKPRADQIFLTATAAQLDKNVTDSQRNLERVDLRFVNDLSEQRRPCKDQTQKGKRK